MNTLNGKTALVTGGSRGIGRASALALAKAGAQVIVHYGNAKEEADAVVASIREAGGRADAVSAGLAASDGPAKLAAQVRRIVGDRLDIVVANAGVPKSVSLVVAEGDYVMLHGRFSAIGLPADWVVVNIVRVENGRLAEHWDVIQDEATKAQSKSGNPMFGKNFPA